MSQDDDTEQDKGFIVVETNYRVISDANLRFFFILMYFCRFMLTRTQIYKLLYWHFSQS